MQLKQAYITDPHTHHGDVTLQRPQMVNSRDRKEITSARDQTTWRYCREVQRGYSRRWKLKTREMHTNLEEGDPCLKLFCTHPTLDAICFIIAEGKVCCNVMRTFPLYVCLPVIYKAIIESTVKHFIGKSVDAHVLSVQISLRLSTMIVV